MYLYKGNPMARTKIQTTITVDIDLLNDIRRLADITGVPMSRIFENGAKKEVSLMEIREKAVNKSMGKWEEYYASNKG